MKRISFMITALLLIGTALLFAVSCSDNSAQNSVALSTTSATATSAVTTSPPIAVAKDKISAYTVIYPEKADKNEISAASSVYDALKDIAGVSRPSRKTDFVRKGDSSFEDAREILIGVTNRKESAQALSLLGNEQFSISVIGNKIVIIGCDPAATALAADTFIKEYIKNETVEVPADMNRIFDAELSFTYKEIKNPVYESGNDPWVVRQGNSFYYCWSDGGVKVKKIENLDDISNTGGSRVWAPPANTEYSHEIWAPELHYINGEWYIYVAADDGQNANHRMYVLKGTSQDPTDPFTFVGKITDPSDRWAIDGTVLQFKGELYFIWSGWEGYVDGSQLLYIAHMSDPTTIDSQRVCISVPTYSWEKNGMPLNEGPVCLTDEEKGTAIVVFSASGSWTDDYCLGALTLTGDDPMDASSWTKASAPLMTKAEGAYGPGHCSFVTDYEGSLWVIYHANLVSGSGWSGRSCRAQKVEKWDGKTLIIGKPAGVDEIIKVPYKVYSLGEEVTGK